MLLLLLLPVRFQRVVLVWVGDTMGVHLYTNGAWTDSGRIYRNSVNLFDKTANYTVGVTTYNFTISDLDPDKYYTCSTNFERISGVTTASLYFNGGNSVENGVWNGEPKTFKPNSNGEIVVFVRFQEASGAPSIYNDLISGSIWVMVNEGSTTLPYEPYNIVDWYTNNGHGYSSGAWS